MTIIIFSDTHLTGSFSNKKFNYLMRIISSADKVIINGDFWDAYQVSFEMFIKSRWRNLFPALVAKQSIYLYGNHDHKKYSQEGVRLFSQQQRESYSLKMGKVFLKIEHGHRIAPAEDEEVPAFFKQKLFVAPYVLFREILPLALLGKLSLQQYKRQNEKMKQWVTEYLPKNQVLVCGHSHLAEFNLESRYINTGFIRHGYGQYLRISGSKLNLIDEIY